MINPVDPLLAAPSIMVEEPATNVLATFVLILHTVFGAAVPGSPPAVTTIKIQGYSEEKCDHAARAYEAAGMLSQHGLREAGGELKVLTMIAVCLPGPDGAP